MDPLVVGLKLLFFIPVAVTWMFLHCSYFTIFFPLQMLLVIPWCDVIHTFDVFA